MQIIGLHPLHDQWRKEKKRRKGGKEGGKKEGKKGGGSKSRIAQKLLREEDQRVGTSPSKYLGISDWPSGLTKLSKGKLIGIYKFETMCFLIKIG